MKCALITGSSKGIGTATARLFRKEGYFVFLHGRDVKALEALEKEFGQKDSILVADLTNPEQIDEICKKVEGVVKFQGLKFQTLVNNAGYFKSTPAKEMQHDLWQTHFQANLLGPARLTEKLIPLLIQHAPSSIVNVASTLGLRPVAGYSAYSATKAAMINWSQTLALELGPEQVRVNCICPGLVDTPIHSFHSLPASEKEAAKLKMRSLQPLGRIGDPVEIAESIFFLASQKSKWTTGAVLNVDGGIHLK